MVALMVPGLYGAGISTAYAVSLEETVNDAVHYNPLLKGQAINREITQEDVKEARSAFFPTISATAQAGRASLNNETTRRRTTDEGGVQSYTGEGFIALNQPLYDGHSTINRYLAAKSYKKASDLEYNAGRVDIIRQAVVSHIDVARLRTVVQKPQGFLTDVADYRTRMELMVNEGALGHSDLLQAEELIMLTRSALLDYQKQQSLAEARYEEIVGHVPEAGLDISTAAAESLLPANLNECLVIARQSHPYLKSAAMTAEAMKREVRAEQGAVIPRLDAELSYRKGERDDRMGGETQDAQAVLNLAWDFSLGGAYSARVDRSEKLREQALAEHDQRRNTIERDIKQRFAELTSAQRNLEILAEREKANREIFRSYNQEYEAGARTILDIINAQNKLFDAEVNLVNGYYSRKAAIYDLLGAIGRIDEAFGYDNVKIATQ
jgi:TolC family type I secretion outer membrane protein